MMSRFDSEDQVFPLSFSGANWGTLLALRRTHRLGDEQQSRTLL